MRDLLGELARGELQPIGDDVRVREQQLAGRGEREPAGPALEQPRPAWRSSAAICWETAGWVSDSASAARENEPSLATSRKVSTRRGSIIDSAYGMAEMMI